MKNTLTVLIVISAAWACAAQDAGGPRFEVASVKLAGNVPFSGLTGGPGTSSPNRIQYSPVSIRTLVCDALNVKRDQVLSSAPIDSLSWLVTATLPPQSTKSDLQAMLLQLLGERFGLTYHREVRTLQRLELQQDREGSKLGEPDTVAAAEWNEVISRNTEGSRRKDTKGFPILPAGPAWAQARGDDGIVRLTCTSCSMTFFGAMALNTLVSHQQGLATRSPANLVYDNTGLKGHYNIHLQYVESSPSAGGAEALAAPGEDFTAALRHQLGLRIVTVKTPTECIVIDHVNRVPTEN